MCRTLTGGAESFGRAAQKRHEVRGEEGGQVGGSGMLAEGRLDLGQPRRRVGRVSGRLLRDMPPGIE